MWWRGADDCWQRERWDNAGDFLIDFDIMWALRSVS